MADHRELTQAWLDAGSQPMPKTSTEAYKEQADEVAANLAIIQAALLSHRDRQKNRPFDWAYVGDMTYWNETLNRIIDSRGLSEVTTVG